VANSKKHANLKVFIQGVIHMNKAPHSNAKHFHWGRLGRSVLNGVLGDYLEKENNPLAIKMGFYHKYRALSLNDKLAQQVDFPLTNKIVVFVHGLTNLETVWDFDAMDAKTSGNSVDAQGAYNDIPIPYAADKYNIDNYIGSYFDASLSSENYGVKLKSDFGFTPFFLRYNTGLTLEKNGRELSKLMTKLVDVYPIDIDDIVIVGFSMGALLSRYAQSVASETKHKTKWREKLSKCFYIGTADESVQDLKGDLKRQGKDQEVGSDVVCDSFFSAHARHYFISGTNSDNNSSLLDRVLGDSSIKLANASPRSAPTNCQNAYFEGVSAVPLAHSERVYQQIKHWIEDDSHRQCSPSRTKIKRYELLRKPYTEEPEDDVSTKALMAGTIDLLATGYEKALEAVESIHYSIADEPFSVMQKIPLVSQVADPVENVHKEVLNVVYRSLRLGGKLVHQVAKQIASEEMELASNQLEKGASVKPSELCQTHIKGDVLI